MATTPGGTLVQVQLPPEDFGFPKLAVMSRNQFSRPEWCADKPTLIYAFYERNRNGQEIGWIRFRPEYPFLIFGRDLGAIHVFVGHPTVSCQHAVVVWSKKDSLCYIMDLESSHGTFINNQLIPTSAWTILPANAILKFGNSASTFAFCKDPETNPGLPPSALMPPPLLPPITRPVVNHGMPPPAAPPLHAQPLPPPPDGPPGRPRRRSPSPGRRPFPGPGIPRRRSPSPGRGGRPFSPRRNSPRRLSPGPGFIDRRGGSPRRGGPPLRGSPHRRGGFGGDRPQMQGGDRFDPGPPLHRDERFDRGGPPVRPLPPNDRFGRGPPPNERFDRGPRPNDRFDHGHGPGGRHPPRVDDGFDRRPPPRGNDRFPPPPGNDRFPPDRRDFDGPRRDMGRGGPDFDHRPPADFDRRGGGGPPDRGGWGRGGPGFNDRGGRDDRGPMRRDFDNRGGGAPRDDYGDRDGRPSYGRDDHFGNRSYDDRGGYDDSRGRGGRGGRGGFHGGRDNFRGGRGRGRGGY